MSGPQTELEKLQLLELQLEELYAWLAGVFAEDSEASELFALLSREERSHAKLVGHELRLLASDETVAVLELSDVEIDGLLDQIRELKGDGAAPRLDQAVATSLLIESSGAESYRGAAVVSSRPAINEMLDKLAAANREHAARLERFAEARKMLVWVE